MASIKIQKLQELIRQKVATLLLRGLADPRISLVTISRVKLTRDMSHCKIYWSSLEDGGGRTRIAKALEDARGYVQREVARVLATRRTPVLQFVFDEAIEGMERVAEIIRSARDEDDSRALARGDELEDADPADVEDDAPEGGTAGR